MANVVLQAMKQKQKQEKPFSFVNTVKECLGINCDKPKVQGKKISSLKKKVRKKSLKNNSKKQKKRI